MWIELSNWYSGQSWVFTFEELFCRQITLYETSFSIDDHHGILHGIDDHVLGDREDVKKLEVCHAPKEKKSRNRKGNWVEIEAVMHGLLEDKHVAKKRWDGGQREQ